MRTTLASLLVATAALTAAPTTANAGPEVPPAGSSIICIQVTVRTYPDGGYYHYGNSCPNPMPPHAVRFTFAATAVGAVSIWFRV